MLADNYVILSGLPDKEENRIINSQVEIKMCLDC